MEESQFLKFLSKNWKILFSAAVLLAVFAIFLDRVIHRHHIASKNDFLAVKRSVFEFRSGRPVDADSLHELEKIALRHPELHPTVDHIFALTLVEQGKIEEGVSYASSSLKRVEPFVPSFYSDYCKASTLIFEERYLEALNEAKDLELKLAQKPQGFAKLEAFNLLRILFLAKKIGDDEKVPLAWEK